MSYTQGMLVKYITKQGLTQYAHLMRADQRDELVKQNKVIIRLVHADTTPLMENDKQKSVVKDLKHLTKIGYFD